MRPDRSHGKSHLINQTIAVISHVLLAMLYYPGAFEKASEEIAGTERLPTFDGRVSFSYGMHSL